MITHPCHHLRSTMSVIKPRLLQTAESFLFLTILQIYTQLVFRPSILLHSFKAINLGHVRRSNSPNNTLRPTRNRRHFCGRHFQKRFLERKCNDFENNFTEIYSQLSNEQNSSIGLDNGLAPTRQQAIIWINDDYLTDAYIRHSASTS